MSDLIKRESVKAEIRKKFTDLGDRIKINTVINQVPSADKNGIIRYKLSKPIEYVELVYTDKEVTKLSYDSNVTLVTPKGDRPTIVRCKDCRHGWYDDDVEYYTCRHPKGLNEELYGVDFCSYGERKEE